MTHRARQEYLEQLAAHALERYRQERRNPQAELEIDPAHLSTAAAVAECLVIGLSDPGEHWQTLLTAVADTVSVGLQAVINELIATRRDLETRK